MTHHARGYREIRRAEYGPGKRLHIPKMRDGEGFAHLETRAGCHWHNGCVNAARLTTTRMIGGSALGAAVRTSGAVDLARCFQHSF